MLTVDIFSIWHKNWATLKLWSTFSCIHSWCIWDRHSEICLIALIALKHISRRTERLSVKKLCFYEQGSNFSMYIWLFQVYKSTKVPHARIYHDANFMSDHLTECERPESLNLRYIACYNRSLHYTTVLWKLFIPIWNFALWKEGRKERNKTKKAFFFMQIPTICQKKIKIVTYTFQYYDFRCILSSHEKSTLIIPESNNLTRIFEF